MPGIFAVKITDANRKGSLLYFNFLKVIEEIVWLIAKNMIVPS